jgi:Fe2+ or Zn2+ uptake regulation protein
MARASPPPLASADDWLQRLQAQGYRLTAPRRAVVEIIAASQHVLDPQRIYDLAKERYPKLGLVTVYRTVEKLEELGLIERVHRPQGCQAFIASVRGHQHLLICASCGRVSYFGGGTIDTLVESVESESGYQVDDHWFQLFGRCAACQ